MDITYQLIQIDDNKYSIIASDGGIAGKIVLYGGRWEFNPTGDYTFELEDLELIIAKLREVQK